MKEEDIIERLRKLPLSFGDLHLTEEVNKLINELTSEPEVGSVVEDKSGDRYFYSTKGWVDSNGLIVEDSWESDWLSSIKKNQIAGPDDIVGKPGDQVERNGTIYKIIEKDTEDVNHPSISQDKIDGSIRALLKMQDGQDWTNHPYAFPASFIRDYIQRIEKENWQLSSSRNRSHANRMKPENELALRVINGAMLPSEAIEVAYKLAESLIEIQAEQECLMAGLKDMAENGSNEARILMRKVKQ